jgi:CRISPR-associated endoribonuclease Cas6
MRFKLYFKGETCDYTDEIRRKFISFIKKVFKNHSEAIYHLIFSSKKVRPYVYSPFFGKDFEEKKIGPEISFIFSSGDYQITSSFWNGLLTLKEKKAHYLKINEKKFILNNIQLLPKINIKSFKVIFKTVGVAVLTDPSASSRDFKNWYLIPEKENIDKFNEVLKERVKQKYKIIKAIDIEPNLKFTLLEDYPLKETIIPLFNGFIRGFRGYFLLEGDREILKFLYDYGFGVRTGQGFGLLTIVKQL